MPHSSHTQQTKTHEAAAGYSPRLCNDDLAPTRDQNWSWYNIFSFWMSDVHSMGGYVVAASFFTLGWPAGRFCSACWWASVLSSCAPTWWRSRARWPGCLTR